MSILDQIFPKKGTHIVRRSENILKRQAAPTPPPIISMDTFQRFKDRLIEQYQKEPKFHALVERFHASMQDGSITSEALFDALFLAKELFIQQTESRILADLEWEHQHGKEKL